MFLPSMRRAGFSSCFRLEKRIEVKNDLQDRSSLFSMADESIKRGVRETDGIKW
jgi:hypothetical protein